MHVIQSSRGPPKRFKALWNTAYSYINLFIKMSKVQLNSLDFFFESKILSRTQRGKNELATSKTLKLPLVLCLIFISFVVFALLDFKSYYYQH